MNFQFFLVKLGHFLRDKLQYCTHYRFSNVVNMVVVVVKCDWCYSLCFLENVTYW